MGMMKNKVMNMSVEDMVKQLKSDLKKSTNTSYNSDGIIMLKVDGVRITWDLYKGHLRRYDYPVTDVSTERVRSFKYQFNFGSYFAFEVVSVNGPMFGMVQIQG